jgi:hypothetical protein
VSDAHYCKNLLLILPAAAAVPITSFSFKRPALGKAILSTDDTRHYCYKFICHLSLVYSAESFLAAATAVASTLAIKGNMCLYPDILIVISAHASAKTVSLEFFSVMDVSLDVLSASVLSNHSDPANSVKGLAGKCPSISSLLGSEHFLNQKRAAETIARIEYIQDSKYLTSSYRAFLNKFQEIGSKACQ